MLTHEQLLAEVQYDPDTGVWRRKPSRRHPEGRIAGSISCNARGYKHAVVSIFGKNYKAHRLAWFYMTGCWPIVQIDHRDTNSLNNRWKNLREATATQNKYNAGARKDNKSGVRGVTKTPHGRFVVRIYYEGKSHYLGTFSELLTAKWTYDAKAKQLFGEFAYAG